MIPGAGQQLELTNFLSEAKEEKHQEEQKVLDSLSEPDAKLRQGLSNLAQFVRQKFQMARDDRSQYEQTWIKAWNAFRGELSAEERNAVELARTRNPFSSSIFIKITKTKTMAAYGQVLEILEADDRFPISVEATPIPEGVPEHVYLDNEGNSQQSLDDGDPVEDDPYGYPGDGREIPKGTTAFTSVKEKLGQIAGFIGGKALKMGASPDKNALIQLDPAKESAMKMDRVIQDQMTEANASKELQATALEMCLYGTGILKGPFTVEKTIHNWQRDPATKKMTYKPIYRDAPDCEYVNIWDFYPDPEATEMEDCSFVVQRHLLSADKLRKLGDQPTFDEDAIARVLDKTPGYAQESWESIIRDGGLVTQTTRYEVLEYWGYLSKDMGTLIGLDIPNSIADTIQVNIWVSGSEVLRVVLNPFTPTRIPYQVAPYEKHPGQIWGIGVAENMNDVQSLMNGSMRAAIDNLKLAGSCILEVNTNHLVGGQNHDIYAGKIFYTEGPPGQAINSLDFKDTSQSHLQMFDKARQLADEKTGIPSYSHGQTGVSGTTRTASGMSMLMGAAALNIKTVVSNVDQYLLKPLGEALYAWNMQFNESVPDIRGDLNVKASGTKSLMQREVVTQRILSLIQVASNPLFAPFFNAENAFKEIARNMDLDPETFVNDPKAAALYAEMMSRINGPQTNPASASQAGAITGPQANGGVPSATGGVNPADATGSGGGNIGTGSAPAPGTPGFAG